MFSIIEFILTLITVVGMSITTHDKSVFEIDDNPDATMAKIVQSGFKQWTVDVHGLHLQASAGVYPFLPAGSADWDNWSALQGGTQSYSWDADGMSFAQYLYYGLWTQALTWQRYMTNTASPSWWEPDSTSVVGYWISCFLDGMLNNEFPNVKNDGSVWQLGTDTIKDALQGFSWDDEGAGTQDKHWQKLRAIAYVFGLKRRNDVPPITEKATDAQIHSRERYMVIRAIRDVKKIIDLFPLMGLTSDKMVFAAGKMVLGYIPETVPKEMYGTEMDAEWLPFMNRAKQDYIGNSSPTFKTSSGYRSFTWNFFNYDYLDNSDFDKVLKFTGTKLYVDADALKTARMFCGVGKVTINGEESWFMNLFNLAINSSSGLWDNHMISGPTKQWYAGINMAIVLNMYKEPYHEKWYEGLTKISNYDHWTGGAIKGMSDDMIETDMKSAVKGMAESDVYRPLMSCITYTDSDGSGNQRDNQGGWLEHPQVPDPTIAIDSSSPYNPLYGAGSTGLRAARHSWYFLMFIMKDVLNRLQDEDGIGFFVNNWTKSEIGWIQFICLFFGTGSSTFDGDSKFSHTRLLLFPMIDSRIPEKQETLAYSINDVIRVRSLKNYQNWSSFPTFAVKYSTCLLPALTPLDSSEALFTGPRPKALDKTTSRRRFNVGVLDNEMAFLIESIPTGASITDKFENKISEVEDELENSPKVVEQEPVAKASKGAKPKAINVKSDNKPPTPNKDDE
jgi:hypothetical protein